MCERIVRFLGLTAFGLLIGCGGSTATRIGSGPDPLDPGATHPATANTLATQKSESGPPVHRGEEFEITGFESATVIDSNLTVALIHSQWREIVIDGEKEREASADLQVFREGKIINIRVLEGGSVPAFDHIIECRLADQAYNPERGDMVPHVRLLVRLAR